VAWHGCHADLLFSATPARQIRYGSCPLCVVVVLVGADVIVGGKDGRGWLEGMRSPAPKEVHLLMAFAAPGLAPRLALACAAVIVFAVWRVGVGTWGFGWPVEPSA